MHQQYVCEITVCACTSTCMHVHMWVCVRVYMCRREFVGACVHAQVSVCVLHTYITIQPTQLQVEDSQYLFALLYSRKILRVEIFEVEQILL